jgi:mannose-1-phosphate guanylyltransferase
MKAFLLAGGRGERLGTLTQRLPKCLVSINGQPLLDIWLDLLVRHGVTEVLLNVSHHEEQVRARLAARPTLPHVRLIVEPAPIGNAGTVVSQRAFVNDGRDFWICYADTLTGIDLTGMADAHARHDGPLTMALFRAPDPRAAGIVTLDERGIVVGFDEKPSQPRSDLANAGVYLARPELLDRIPVRSGIVDFGRDVLPPLCGRMGSYVVTEFLRDIGTPSALDAAQREWLVSQSAS